MKYIIDVTQLVHWPGRLTGIPRVVQEIAIRFPSNEREVVFASWVKELGDMFEVDLMSTLAIRGNGIEYIKSPPNASAGSTVVNTPVEPTKISLTRHSKNLAKKVIRRLGVDQSDVVVRLRGSMYNKELQTYKRVQRESGDVLFIGAGEWWDDNFIDLVAKCHNEGVKIVQLSHDMLPIVTPQFSGHATESLSAYNTAIMPICDLVLANSESTKKDVMSWLKSKKLHTPNIEVFRIGEDFSVATPQKPVDEIFRALKVNGQDFLLCVGTIEARKNHALLYYTYKLAKSRGVKLPTLILVGGRGWKTEEIYGYITADPETKSDIIPMHNVSDEELSWLYDNCLFTIYPSFYEGWGMPIAESIMRGTPVLASNTSSMIEVAPGYATYFNPASTDELLGGIMNLLEPTNLKTQRTKIKSYKATTWDDTFAQVINYVEKI